VGRPGINRTCDLLCRKSDRQTNTYNINAVLTHRKQIKSSKAILLRSFPYLSPPRPPSHTRASVTKKYNLVPDKGGNVDIVTSNLPFYTFNGVFFGWWLSESCARHRSATGRHIDIVQQLLQLSCRTHRTSTVRQHDVPRRRLGSVRARTETHAALRRPPRLLRSDGLHQRK